jgi:hypothetical protein
VAPVLHRCVRVVRCGGDRGADFREAEVGIPGGARTRFGPAALPDQAAAELGLPLLAAVAVPGSRSTPGVSRTDAAGSIGALLDRADGVTGRTG